MNEVKAAMFMGDCRCVACLPTGVGIDDPEVVLLDKDSEVLSNECIICGHIHEDVKLVNTEEQPEEEQELVDEPQPEDFEEPDVVLPEHEEHDRQIGEEEDY